MGSLSALGHSEVSGSPLSRLGDKLLQTWPARLARTAFGAATLPGDEWAGRVQPGSNEEIQRAADLAGLMVGTPGRPTANTLGSSFTLDYFGQPVKIMENPSPRELAGFINRTKYKAARAVTDTDSGTRYVWDAADPALHQMVAEQLGFRFDPATAETLGIE